MKQIGDVLVYLQVTEMNKRWQDYNNQREAYVKKLLTDLNDLQKRVAESSSNQGNTVSHETQVEMNRILDEARRLTRELDEQKRVAARAKNDQERVSVYHNMYTKGI